MERTPSHPAWQDHSPADRDDWADEQTVLGYRSQYHVEEAFRCMKNPHFLTFRPTFHWTDQKLRVHAFYCVLALMILSILRRKLGQKGIRLSIPAMMQKLADIREVAVVYQSPQKSSKTLVRRKLSKQGVFPFSCKRAFCPVGTDGNSPPIYRWGQCPLFLVP